MTTPNGILQIPGIGKTIAYDLVEMGITEVKDLRGQDIFSVILGLDPRIQDIY